MKTMLLSLTLLMSMASFAQTADPITMAKFNGCYTFTSQGWAFGWWQQPWDTSVKPNMAPFTESGKICSDGMGSYILDSTMNSLWYNWGLIYPHSCGTYSIASNLVGAAVQTDCVHPTSTDTMSIYMNSDGSRIVLQSTDLNFTWTAILIKD